MESTGAISRGAWGTRTWVNGRASALIRTREPRADPCECPGQWEFMCVGNSIQSYNENHKRLQYKTSKAKQRSNQTFAPRSPTQFCHSMEAEPNKPDRWCGRGQNTCPWWWLNAHEEREEGWKLKEPSYRGKVVVILENRARPWSEVVSQLPFEFGNFFPHGFVKGVGVV